MKIKIISLAIILMCLCCRNADNSHPESSDTTITRHDEVFKIWSDYDNRRMEDYLNKYPACSFEPIRQQNYREKFF